MKAVLIALSFCALLISCGGQADNNQTSENGTNNASNQTLDEECVEDEDCEGMTQSFQGNDFLHPDTLTCETNVDNVGYCSECLFDNHCQEGEACRERTYCEELPSCETGADCGSPDTEMHYACIDGFCKNCFDDSDCDAPTEVCYSLRCVTREVVDAACIDATCEPPASCEMVRDDEDNVTAIECTENRGLRSRF